MPIRMIRFLFFGLMIAGLSACSTISETFKPAELTLVDFQPAAVGSDEYQAVIRMKFKNLNSYAVQIGEVKYKLVINNDDVAEGSFDKEVVIQPSAEEEVVAKIKFKYVSDQAVTQKLAVEQYMLSGTASVGLHMVHFKHVGDFVSAKKQ